MSAGAVTVYLVDASPYVFRAHFSLPSSLKSPDGARVGAVYGFGAFLLKLIAAERPTHLGVAFDRDLTGSFFRNQLYPEYKSQRAPAGRRRRTLTIRPSAAARGGRWSRRAPRAPSAPGFAPRRAFAGTSGRRRRWQACPRCTPT
jgi:5'-3' exonuclease